MAFKMKGSPMQRNFGIGASPLKNDKNKLAKKKTRDEYYKHVADSLVKNRGIDITKGSKRDKEDAMDGLQLVSEIANEMTEKKFGKK